jgi:hypothetical protein
LPGRLISDLIETRHQLVIDRLIATADDDDAGGTGFFRGGNLGIRETINRNSKASTIVVICALVLGVIVIGLELRGQSGKLPTKYYYTIDDGQTWFADSSTKLPPFDHDGKQAVRCYVFKSTQGKFAALLQKYDDKTLEQLAHRTDQIPPRDATVLVKKPGEKRWTTMGLNQQALILMHVTGPDNSPAEPVMP